MTSYKHVVETFSLKISSIFLEMFYQLLISLVLTVRLDPLQFPYCPSRSVEDASSTGVHLSMVHLLLVEFSSVFTTHGRTLPAGTEQNWILDFLTS